MSVDPPDYDAIEEQYWKLFNQEVVQEAYRRDDRLLKRVDTYVSRFGYPTEEVLNKIKQDPMFAAHFAKEPRRMSVHEKEAAKWIEALPGVEKFKTLPKSGKNAFKVSSDGNVVQLKQMPNLPGKSLDFRWKTEDATFYAMHKYTKEGGGTQDSQYQEMVELMKRFLHCRDEKLVLAVIVDGEYYQENNAKRLRILQSHQRPQAPKSHALTIGELPDLLKKYML